MLFSLIFLYFQGSKKFTDCVLDTLRLFRVMFRQQEGNGAKQKS